MHVLDAEVNKQLMHDEVLYTMGPSRRRLMNSSLAMTLRLHSFDLLWICCATCRTTRKLSTIEDRGPIDRVSN